MERIEESQRRGIAESHSPQPGAGPGVADPQSPEYRTRQYGPASSASVRCTVSDTRGQPEQPKKSLAAGNLHHARHRPIGPNDLPNHDPISHTRAKDIPPVCPVAINSYPPSISQDSGNVPAQKVQPLSPDPDVPKSDPSPRSRQCTCPLPPSGSVCHITPTCHPSPGQKTFPYCVVPRFPVLPSPHPLNPQLRIPCQTSEQPCCPQGGNDAYPFLPALSSLLRGDVHKSSPTPFVQAMSHTISLPQTIIQSLSTCRNPAYTTFTTYTTYTGHHRPRMSPPASQQAPLPSGDPPAASLRLRPPVSLTPSLGQTHANTSQASGFRFPHQLACSLPPHCRLRRRPSSPSYRAALGG
ncbi:hypothetical protein CH063_15370 [Colletotrichum higginsianum]|uniref:Uncharacterized protein n=1 Tax=Colletotrichum higginsianum (strain IMI 349063) TaxID=759273 RepID=H1W2I0_COLHI|nr:hypothetical protein CH063_15370 [Colletotrichum higginsianum]